VDSWSKCSILNGTRKIEGISNNESRGTETMKKLLAKLTRMMLNAVDKRLPKAERDLWQRQAWIAAKHIENGGRA
jgi:hypothetical protein